MPLLAYKLPDIPITPSTWSVFEPVNLNNLIEIMSTLKPTMCPQQGRFLTTIEGWAGRYPGWALGVGGRLDIYTVDIAILNIVCYMYTGEKRKTKLSWAA